MKVWAKLLLLGALIAVYTAHATVTIPSSSFPLRQLAQDGNLYAQGEVGVYVNAPVAGTYTFGLNAFGTPAGGVYPLVGLSINSLVKETQSIGANLAAYTFSGYLSAGVQQVGWFLLNDANIAGQDRNVFISSMTVTPPAGVADVTLSAYAAWVSAAQARENQAVAESAAAIDTYRKGPATVHVVNAQGQAIAGATVQIQQLSHAFRFGASTAGLSSFSTSALNDTYAAKFKALFNYGTIPMYWSLVEAVQGQPNYATTDYQVNWCTANNIRTKGHAVLWAYADALPAWTNGIPSQQTQLDHVSALLTHFPQVGAWDVVNEAFNAPGMASSAAQSRARSVSPGAELVVNDYGEFYNGHPEIHAQLQQDIAAGVPIDAVGFESHAPLDTAFPLDRVRDVLAYYGTLGKPIHITEFCPSSGGYAVTGNPWRSVWDEATQADYAEKFYRVCFGSPAVDAITWWDVCDTNAWCPQSGLLRADMSSKPSYDQLNALINTEWHTNLSGTSAATGAYSFRGFYGKQHVTVTSGSTSQVVDVDIVKGAANDFTVTLNVSTPPPAPTVAVNRLVTKNTKPTFGGTVANAASVSVKVNGLTYTATMSGGTWSVALTTALTAGIYDVQATAKSSSNVTASDATTGELTIDLSAPVITITGSSLVSVKKNTTYTDGGATATDNVDGNITSRIVKSSTVNTSVIGTYYVRYNVSDTAGNAAAQKTRTVKVTL